MTLKLKMKPSALFALPFGKPASRPAEISSVGTLSRRELQTIVAAMLG